MKYVPLNSLNMKQTLVYSAEIPVLHSDVTAHGEADDL